VRPAVCGLFFGVGFLLGFLICFGCLRAKTAAELQMYSRAGGESVAAVRAASAVKAPPRPASADAGPSSADLSGVLGVFEASGELGDSAEAPGPTGAGEDLWIDALPAEDIDLVLAEDGLGSDENGFFISGTVLNDSVHAFDAVRVTFDLCDRSGEPYADVTDASNARMEPGDVWGFTIYIPYMNMEKFSSYRLQSIMGVTN
jgi:hypothetical protein